MMDHAHEFLELLSRDEPMRTQLVVYSPKTLDDVVGFARGKGFIFTEAELRNTLVNFPVNAVTETLRELA